MSTRPIGSELPREERRAHPRRRLDRLAYVDFGPDNGGILIDASEGGLNFQVVGVLIEGQPCHVRFLLPGTDAVVEAQGKISWSNGSKRGGGLQFVEISDEARRRLREWVAMAPAVAAPIEAQDAADGTADAPGSALPNVTMMAGEHGEQTRLAAALAAARPAPSPVPAPIPAHRPALAGPGAASAPVRSVVEMTKQPSAASATRPAPLRPTAVRTEPFVQETPKREAATTEHERQPALRPRFVGVVVFLLLAALASQSGRLAYLVSGSADYNAEKASPAPTGPFRVDITDVSGRRFTISSDVAETQTAAAVIAAPAPKSPARSDAVPAAPAHAAEPPTAAPAPAPARVTAAAPSTPIAAPRVPQPVAAAEAPPVIIYTPAASEPISAPLPVAPAPPQTQQIQPAGPAIPAAPASTFVAATLIHRVDPPYAPKSGTVVVKLRIGMDGIPQDLALVSGDHGLGGLAMDAIKKWRYQPATMNGRIVESETTVSMQINVKQ